MQQRIRLHVLATGSKGNCAAIEDGTTGECIVIDCGICKRDFMARTEQAGFDAARIRAFFMSHAHGDHTSGLGVCMRGLRKLGSVAEVYADPTTVAESAPLQKVAGEFGCVAFEPSEPVQVGAFCVTPFPTSHDTLVSYGFRIECGGDALGFMTDTGIVTPQAREALQGCRILALEANHDVGMLQEGPYPYWLKQRIAGSGGHLSNEQSRQLLEELAWEGLEQVVAMHRSEENNTLELAAAAHAQALEAAGCGATSQVGLQGALVSAK